LDVVFHPIFPPTIMLAIKVWWSSYGLTFKYALWSTHLQGSLKVLAFQRRTCSDTTCWFREYTTIRGGWIMVSDFRKFFGKQS